MSISLIRPCQLVSLFSIPHFQSIRPTSGIQTDCAMRMCPSVLRVNYGICTFTRDIIGLRNHGLYGSTSCCISHGPSQWERAIFDPSQLGDPSTDFHET